MLSRLIKFVALAFLMTGCSTILQLANSAYDFCPSSIDTSPQYFGSPHTEDLVIFIHGLCGDSKTTWTNRTTHFVFPLELANDFAEEGSPAYVVAFDYASRLEGAPSILSIADHLEFEISELLKEHAYRRLRIVAHSMGGLVAREYILRRKPQSHPQLSVTNVVLLATPNNGSELAALGRLIPKNRQVDELRHIDKGNTYLESLYKDWNREFKGAAHPRHVLLYAGHEELPMPVFGNIVKFSSAVTFADEAMGFQEDHESIAKPSDRNVLYRWVKAKLEESVERTAQQLLNGMVQQGLIGPADLPQRLPRTVELLEQLQALAGTDLEKILSHVKAGQLQSALALLAENEASEGELIENIAQRRFTQGQLHELQFQMEQAASYYSKAVQLVPTVALYRLQYGWALINTGDSQAAILEFQEAVRLSRMTSDQHSEADGLDGQGIAYSRVGKYEKAIHFHEEALEVRRKIGDVNDESVSLGNLGLAYANQGKYRKAIEFHEQALRIHRMTGHLQGESSALGNLGVAYDYLGQYDKAFGFHERALNISRKIGDLRGEAGDLGNLGVTYNHVGQYAKAVQFHEQSLSIHRRIGDVRGEGTALSDLGSNYAELGDYVKGKNLIEQALAIRRKIGDARGEGKDLTNLGIIYGSIGEYDKAVQFHEESLAIRRKIGDTLGEAITLGNLGVTHEKLRQYAKAIEFHEKALSIYRDIGNVRGEGMTLGNLGVCYDDLREHSKAIELHEKALEIHLKIGDMKSRSHELVNLGIAYARIGQYPKAIELCEQALAIQRKIGDAQGEGSALASLGYAYSRMGQYPEAIGLYDQALVIQRRVGDAQGEGQTLANLGLAYAQMGQHHKAIEMLKGAETIFEKRLRLRFPLKEKLQKLERDSKEKD